MSDDEIICLDDDDDIPGWGSTSRFTVTNTTRRDSLRRLESVIKYSGGEGAFEEPVIMISDSDNEEISSSNNKLRKHIGRRKNKLISDEELLQLNSDEDVSTGFPDITRGLKHKTKKNRIGRLEVSKPAAKIKLPKLVPNQRRSPPTTSTSLVRKKHEDLEDRLLAMPIQGEDSPSKKSPKKKKTLADIVTDIHETSTDEIDSDEINASSEKLNVDPLPSTIAKTIYGTQNKEEPQPCCSKSLLPQLKRKVAETRKRPQLISSDEELPDIEFDMDIDTNFPTNFTTYPSFPFRNATQESKIPDYPRQASQESKTHSTTTASSSASNSQASTNQGTKKMQKESETERKRAEKEVKRLEKVKKKTEEAREREFKKVENELRRNVKPGEAYKFMIIVLDNLIVNKLDALIPQFVAADIRYELQSDRIIQNSITFHRELIHQAMNNDLQLQKVTTIQEEDQIMVLIDSDQAIPMINAQLNRNNINHIDYGVDLISWVDSIKACCPGKKLTLFLYAMDNFFKKVKRSAQKEFRNRVLNANEDQPQKKKRKNNTEELPQISKTELQSALIELQLQTGVNYRMVKDVVELGTSLIQYTKAIADAPFKKQRQESQGFDWFALTDAAGSVKVEKDGSGLRRLWIDQLQQFNNVGMDIATAIVNKYPSPRLLLQAYQRCTNEDEGQCLLRDLTAKTGDGPLARTRKVGPELSKKMYRFFTSTSGDRFLDSTSDRR